MVKKLVRLALASEYQRRPIRRGDITEKVLGSQGRQFKKVFDQAQSDLRSVFGMEMVELPAKEKVTIRQRRGEDVQSMACHGKLLTTTSGCTTRQAKQNYRVMGADLDSTFSFPPP